MNKWSTVLNIPFPSCKQTGNCCRFSTPSTPAVELFVKASQGNEFARDYLSIFIPYSNIEEMSKINPEFAEKVEKSIEEGKCKINIDDIVFYHCKYISENNKCLIYEDRPQLCRDFPDSPFLILPSGCVYEEWSTACKKKYTELKEDLEKSKRELENIKYQQRAIRLLNQLKRVDDKYKSAFILSSFCLVSPGKSWMKFY